MLKIVIGTNEGKVLCISNNENKIKESMVNYLIDTDQEPTEDFYESRNWGEYDIEVYEYHQPQLNENQQIVLEWLKGSYVQGYGATVIITIHLLQKLNDIDVLGDEPVTQAYRSLNTAGEALVVKKFADWALEQEEE
ncbi:hypothetical protein ACFC9A_03565 [Enterococcus casseliflavus]|uniref:hypothetical protein n=1 Tax=Enterococcus casseliflavus TaxID=37734 RepID=UPI0039A55166